MWSHSSRELGSHMCKRPPCISFFSAVTNPTIRKSLPLYPYVRISHVGVYNKFNVYKNFLNAEQ